jgi:hypothetical protein
MIAFAMLAFMAMSARAQWDVVTQGVYCGSFNPGKGGNNKPQNSLDLDWPDSLKLYYAALKHDIQRDDPQVQLGLDTMRLYIELHPYATTAWGETIDAIGQTGNFVYDFSSHTANDYLNNKLEYNWLTNAQQWNSDTNYQRAIFYTLANDINWDVNEQANMWYNIMLLFPDTNRDPVNSPWGSIELIRKAERGAKPPIDTTAWQVLTFPLKKIPIANSVVASGTEHSTSSSLTISPNPVASMLKLDFTLGHGGVASIAIYDETGSAVKQVLNGMRPGGMNELSADLSNIPSGHYFVRLASGTDVITKELIVQH